MVRGDVDQEHLCCLSWVASPSQKSELHLLLSLPSGIPLGNFQTKALARSGTTMETGWMNVCLGGDTGTRRGLVVWVTYRYCKIIKILFLGKKKTETVFPIITETYHQIVLMKKILCSDDRVLWIAALWEQIIYGKVVLWKKSAAHSHPHLLPSLPCLGVQRRDAFHLT